MYTENDLFRVTYLDFEFKRRFLACPNMNEFTADLWAPLEPDNYRNEEACMAFQFLPNFGHFDVPCYRQHRILCQVFDILLSYHLNNRIYINVNCLSLTLC
jgi:hypothetical protein